jgi:hypothetical protein
METDIRAITKNLVQKVKHSDGRNIDDIRTELTNIIVDLDTKSTSLVLAYILDNVCANKYIDTELCDYILSAVSRLSPSTKQCVYVTVPNVIATAIENNNYPCALNLYLNHEFDLNVKSVECLLRKIGSDLTVGNRESYTFFLKLPKNGSIRINRFNISRFILSKPRLTRKQFDDDNDEIFKIMNDMFEFTEQFPDKLSQHDCLLLGNTLITSLSRGSYGYMVSPASKCYPKGMGPVNPIGKICYENRFCEHEITRCELLQSFPNYNKHFAEYLGYCTPVYSEHGIVQILYENVGTFTLSDIFPSKTREHFDVKFGKLADKIWPNRFTFFLTCIGDVFDGIQFLITNNLIHGDLHANNIMVNYDAVANKFVPKIIDLGTLMHINEISVDMGRSETNFLMYKSRVKIIGEIYRFITSPWCSIEALKRHIMDAWGFIDFMMFMSAIPEVGLLKELEYCKTYDSNINAFTEFITNVMNQIEAAYTDITPDGTPHGPIPMTFVKINNVYKKILGRILSIHPII